MAGLPRFDHTSIIIIIIKHDLRTFAAYFASMVQYPDMPKLKHGRLV